MSATKIQKDHPQYPLELSGAEFRVLTNQAVAWIGEFLDSLPQQPCSPSADCISRARSILEPIPPGGESFPQLVEHLFREIFPCGFNTTSPGYLAYIPGGGLPHAAIADLISLAVNRYVGMWSAAPLVATLELAVVRWLCELVGYDSHAGGFLTSGGSLANWAAIVVARETLARDDYPSAVVYTSSQAHHSIAKAAMMAGIPRQRVRAIEVDEQYRIRLDALQRAIVEDRRQGLRPLAIIAQGGTTNTGAVDDLEGLSRITAEEHLWLHVDAAYGGFFLLTARGRQALSGIAAADSITLDPHKGLFLPYGTGCLVVRRLTDLKNVFAARGEYMTSMAADEFVDFCDISPELSREFRGLRIWLPLKMLGVEPFRECLDEKLDLAVYAAHRLQQIPGIELADKPQLSIVAFRLVQPHKTPPELNQLNRILLDRINAGQRVRLSGTSLRCGFVLRLCILCFRTHQDRVDDCLAQIEHEAGLLLRDG